MCAPWLSTSNQTGLRSELQRALYGDPESPGLRTPAPTPEAPLRAREARMCAPWLSTTAPNE